MALVNPEQQPNLETSLLPRPGARIAVIGGGFLGMRLAEGLAERGFEVTILEAASRLGGMADSWKLEVEAGARPGSREQIEWDRHYHVLLESDQCTMALLRRLGLERSIRWGTTKSGFYSDRRHISMSNSLDFLRFPPLNLVDKARLAATILYCSRIENGQRFESTRVVDFLERWSGKRTTHRVWRPLLRSKLGDDLDQVSAAFIWSTIRRLYAARRSGLKTERFGYVTGGYQTINRAYQALLEDRGVEIRTLQPVQAIRRHGRGDSLAAHSLCIELLEGPTLEVDSAILTQAPALAARLCPELSVPERQSLEQITYRGVLCASLLLKRPLRGFYVTNITDEDCPFTGVIETTALVPPEEVGGYNLVYLPKYLAPDDPDFARPDSEILERFIRALLEMYPELDRCDIVASRLSRVRRVTAVPTLHYSRSVPPIRTSVEQLFLVNSAQISNGTLNVNETLLLAETALTEIVEQLSAPHPGASSHQRRHG